MNANSSDSILKLYFFSKLNTWWLFKRNTLFSPKANREDIRKHISCRWTEDKTLYSSQLDRSWFLIIRDQIVSLAIGSVFCSSPSARLIYTWATEFRYFINYMSRTTRLVSAQPPGHIFAWRNVRHEVQVKFHQADIARDASPTLMGVIKEQSLSRFKERK